MAFLGQIRSRMHHRSSTEDLQLVQALAHIPPNHLPTLLEETSNMHCKHLSSSLQFLCPDTPHPALDDPCLASPVLYPLTSEHEDQGYGTQEDEDCNIQALQCGTAKAKHVHWGGVESQVTHAGSQDEEDYEENSPPFSRLLLAAPPVQAPVPTVPQRDVCPEHAARLAVPPCRAMPTAFQMLMHKFEQGIYTMMDVH